jgi:signal transduction histidine kinase
VIRTTRCRISGFPDPLGSVAASLTRFVGAGLVVALAIAVPVGVLTVRVSDDEAAKSFDQVAAVVAGSVVAPAVTPGLLRGEPVPVDLMQQRVSSLVAAGLVGSVTVVGADGHSIWPVDPGRPPRFSALGPDDLHALRTGSVVPGSRDGTRTAVAGIRSSDGTPALVEVTARTGNGPLAATTWPRVVPVTLVALLALTVVQIPLAYGFGRRARRHRATAASLALAAAEAAGTERRRVAGAVHDYVIPEMTGMAHELDAARLGTPGPEETTALLARTARGLRHTIGELRATTFGLLHRQGPDVGLDAALRVLGERLGGAHTGVSVQVDATGPLPRPVSDLLYRCAEESLRNVATHSRADQVEIVVEQDTEHVTMTIDDDGCGFEEARMAERAASGHVGLRALGDLVAQGGGSLTTRSAPGQGTRIAVILPLDAAPPRPEPVR